MLCAYVVDLVGFRSSATPPSISSSPRHESPEYIPHPRDNLSDVGMDEEDQEAGEHRNRSKKDGYVSRIEQILYENPDLQILITQAGKNHEGGGNFIAYTIRTAVCILCSYFGK
jgi:sorting nexin-41/42